MRPDRALPRFRRPAAIGLGAALVVLAGVAAYARTDSVPETLRALPAALLAVGVAALAVSLPGVRLRGIVLGGCFVAAGIFTWTFTSRPLVIWAVLAGQGILALVWSRPWLTGLRALPRLGTAWVGLAYWLFGALGALLVGHVGVAAQRIAYGGVFGLCALAVVGTLRRPEEDATLRRPEEDADKVQDPSVGIAAAMLLGLAALLLVGSASVFAAVHDVPGFAASNVMRGRFWGGPGLYFHPNSMAGLAVIAAARIGPDRVFAGWQRLAGTVLAGFLLYLTNSRIAFVFAVAVAVVHAVLLVRRRHADLPTYRRPWLAALLPFLVLVGVLAASGGQKFLVQSRFEASSGADVTSGRLDTWGQVGRDWLHDGWAAKLLGNTDTSRAVVVRDDDPPGANGKRPGLNTDNAAVGAFRRGGVLGALAFAGGLLLLAYNLVLRRLLARRISRSSGSRWSRNDATAGRPAPAWLLVAAIGALPTIATEDWWLGGTNGGIWFLLLAGEAYLLWAASPRLTDPTAAAAFPAAPAVPVAASGGRTEVVEDAGTGTPVPSPR